MFVQRRRDPRRLHLQIHFVAELVLVPEDRLGGASVRVVLARVEPSHVREPEVSLRVQRHPGVVDRLELALLALQHPVDFGTRVTVRGLAGELEGLPLVSGHHMLAVGLLKGVELGFPHEHRVGCGRAPFVLGEALVLAEVLLARLAHDERASPGLLRYTVVVARVLEWLSVLDPSVPVCEEKVMLSLWQQ